jgi:hypothetical protein
VINRMIQVCRCMWSTWLCDRVLICKFTEAGRKQRAVMSPFSLIRSVIKCYGQFFSQQLVHRGHCHTPTDRAMHCRFIGQSESKQWLDTVPDQMPERVRARLCAVRALHHVCAPQQSTANEWSLVRVYGDCIGVETGEYGAVLCVQCHTRGWTLQ